MSSNGSYHVKSIVIVFYNSTSGNCQGKHLSRYNIQDYRLKSRPWVKVFLHDIKDVQDVQVAIGCIKYFLIQERDVRIYVFSAGGDGTFVSAIRTLHSAGIDVYNSRIVFSTIPFGTGNDLSQSLGWGRRVHRNITMRPSRFTREIIRRLDGKVIMYDIWHVILKTCDEPEVGYIETRGTSVRVKDIDTLMSNYMSIGLQGEIGVGFEQRRHKSRGMNIMEYTRQSIGLFFKGNLTRLGQYMTTVSDDKNTFTLSKGSHQSSIELLFQNIPGIWGRQVKLWSECHMETSILSPETGSTDIFNWSRRVSPSDGKIEVYAIKSRWDYLMKQFEPFRKNLFRLGQFPQFKMDFNDSCKEIHCMIDGEFFNVYLPESLNVRHDGQIQMLVDSKADI